jgi:glyoxylase-like metal-dependent hydrolase (beta-lactamase superfamily II)
MAACYLLESDTEVAVVETGTNHSVPRILRVLQQRGWTPEQVRYVIVTHVHLDHAGGAGALMQSCPRAELLVHPRGARHMVDPAQLEASVRGVYGDDVFDRDYGTLVPVPEARVRAMADRETVELGRRRLLFRDTPGHARHHFCVYDERSRGWFTGDTFGLSYRETDTARGPLAFPTTTPIQFDPEALKASIRMLAESPADWMYLTHYGRVGEIRRLAGDLQSGVDRLVDIALRHRGRSDRAGAIQDDMMDWLLQAARAHAVELDEGVLREVFKGDVDLNTQGLEFWLDHVA